MKRSSAYKAEGVILNRRDLGDADRIVTLYTREFGRRRLVARGARRPASHLAPHLELFTRVRILAAVGTNLDILSQVEVLESYSRLRTDLAAFAAAGWAIELLDGLSQDAESVPAAYGALLTFLRGLEVAEEPPETWLTALALVLLETHGYQPELRACTVCGMAIAPDQHAFAPATGGVVCSACAPGQETRPLRLDTLKVLRFLAREGFHGAARIRADRATRGELRDVLRAYASSIVEREIKSARMLERAGADPRQGPSG